MSEANVDRFIEFVEAFNRLSETAEEPNREALYRDRGAGRYREELPKRPHNRFH